MIKSKKIRISFMNLDEVLLTRVEGMATNGSINTDGASAVRRTCQLNFISDELKPVNYFELYKTKFLLEVDFGNGFKKQGIYLLTSFSSNISTNNYTFNISGKDKMCLLNGEHGGSFPFSIDVGTKEKIEYNFEPLVTFEYEPGKYYYQNKGEYILDYSPYGTSDKTYYKRLMTSQKEKLTIKEIINNVVVVYGKEQRHNIFINDLEIKGLELLEYRGSDPLYLFRDASSGKIVEITIDGDFNLRDGITPNTLPSNQFFSTSALKPVNYDPLEFQYSDAPSKYCNIIRIQYGEPIGYRDTDLTYAGELTANINENVVSVLDKIKNMLGNYEYFYDEEGHFIFQKRQDYVSNQFSSIGIDGLGMEYQQAPMTVASPIDLTKVASIGQNPQFQNIKNDFSIWGTRSGESGSLPIHSRIAIHQKPGKYVTYSGLSWKVDKNKDSLLYTKRDVDKKIWEQIGDTTKGMWEIYQNSTFPILKEKYQWFYPKFFENLYKGLSTDGRIRYFYASLHWIQVVCNIIDQFGLGDRLIVSNEEGWSVASDKLIKNIFNKLLVATGVVFTPATFGQKIVSLMENEVKAGGFGEIKNFTRDIRTELENEISSFYQSTIYYPLSTPTTVWGQEKQSTIAFLTKDTFGNGLIGHCLRKGSPNEVFEAELVHSFLTNSIANSITLNNYNMTTICNEVYQEFGLSVKKNDEGVKWISILEQKGQEDNQSTYCDFIAFPSFFAIGDNPRAWKSSIQNHFIDANTNVAIWCDQKISNYNSIHDPLRVSGMTIKVSDWREILYQMAKDYYDNGTQPDFWQKINEHNDNLYLSWKTGYEAFYEDILGFWRQLYYDPLYEPLDYELPVGYSLEDYWWGDNDSRNGWHKDVYNNPSGLNFWIDFIEPQGGLATYAIDEIGVKGKYENSSTVKSIAAKNPPALKVLTNMEWALLGENPDPNYTYIQLEGVLANSYTESSQGISALEHTQNLLFNHTYLQESITLSIVPDENLIVNSRVKLNLVNVSGEFTISKITLPLAYNGMMSVTLTKIPPTLNTEIIIKEFE